VENGLRSERVLPVPRPRRPVTTFHFHSPPCSCGSWLFPLLHPARRPRARLCGRNAPFPAPRTDQREASPRPREKSLWPIMEKIFRRREGRGKGTGGFPDGKAGFQGRGDGGTPAAARKGALPLPPRAWPGREGPRARAVTVLPSPKPHGNPRRRVSARFRSPLQGQRRRAQPGRHRPFFHKPG